MFSDSNLQKDLKRYKSEIKSKLLCNTKESKACFENLQEDIDNYIVDNNVISIDDIINHFGTANDIANAFFANVDMRTLKRKINTKKLLTIFVIVVIVIWSIAMILITINSNKETVSFEVVNGIIDESESIILEE